MLNKLRKLQNKKGFTLVELIVVIAIIAILTAVIVPLVSRYTTQATYTNLQAGADSIQSQAAAAISAYSMTGKVFSGKWIYCTASNDGTPDKIYIDGTQIINTSFGGDYAVVPMEAPAATLDKAEHKKMRDSIKEGLKQKLAKDSAFLVTVDHGGVTGVIYFPEGKTLTKDTAVKIDEIKGYDDAYEVDGVACGVLGVFKAAVGTTVSVVDGSAKASS